MTLESQGGNAATLEVGTAAIAEATGEIPEPAQLDATETDASDFSTDSATGDAPTGEPVTYSAEAFEAELGKRLAAETAKLTESHRQKEENAKKKAAEAERDKFFQARSTAAQAARAGLAKRSVLGLLSKAHAAGEAGDKLDFDAQELARVAAVMENQAFQETHERYSEEISYYLADTFPDFSIPRETALKLERATRDYDKGAMIRTYFEIANAALEATLSPKLRKQVEAELAQAADEAKQEAAVKGADQAARGGSKPTSGLQGAAPGKYDLGTASGLAKALNEGAIDDAKFRELWAKRQDNY